MSKDIHKWTDGGYTLMFDEHTFFVFDNEKEKRMTALQVTKKLNEQEATICKLQDLCGESDSENAKLRIENNEQQSTISKLEEEKGYWKSKAMTLLMQVRRLTPRMTDKEVMEFSKELEDE